MKADRATYKGFNCLTVENDRLRLVILPELGAKIASLVYKPQNFEVFFQPTDGMYRPAVYGGDFSRYDTAGADEMYPTIEPCVYPYPGYTGAVLPDHGELWSVPWTVAAAGGSVAAEARGTALPYVFRRTVTLSGSTVQLQYAVKNSGDAPLYGMWAFHGLVACDETSRIVLPGADQVINVHDSRCLGPAATLHRFPHTADLEGRPYRLDRLQPRAARKTEKFYVAGPVASGAAALTLNRNRLVYRLNFPPDRVPYLGLWVNEGGFKGEYNCALEPSTGYYDSLAVTCRNGRLRPLLPGETLNWHLAIELSPLNNC